MSTAPETTLNPLSTDTDGDGMPNNWEYANLLSATHADDARSDFDRDGLTALQEYQLNLATSGQYGKHLGTWSLSAIPRPTGFTTATPSVTLIECASNGIILARVDGTLTGSTGATSYPCTYSPATGLWTRVAAPDGFPDVTSLTPLDVNSSGQVVGYFNSSGTKGFIWTPGATGGQTTVYQLSTSGGPVDAVPKRISDAGYIVGNEGSLSGRSIAATTNGYEVSFSGLWATPTYFDVNDYGEFVGNVTNPFTLKNEAFLAVAGGEVFLTGIERDPALEEALYLETDYQWSLTPQYVPDIDPAAITWIETANTLPGFRSGTAIDRTTYETINVQEGVGAEFYWNNPQMGSASYYWYSYPGYHSSPGLINDWGEFAGNHTGSIRRSTFDFEYDRDTGETYAYHQGYDESLGLSGLYFFEGSYHFSSARPAIYGVSNDPRVLIGTPYAIWSGSLVVPITDLIPSGSPSNFNYARLADRGRVFLQQYPASQIHLLQPDQDADHDGMPNVWEWKYGLNYNDASDAAGDLDGDGLSNLREFLLGTEPNDPDTDNDGVSDGREALTNGTNPLAYRDVDDDGIPDDWELDFCHRLLARRDVLTPGQIAILETNNLDPQTDILAEGIPNLQRSQEEIDSPITPSSPDRVFLGKTRSIINGQIHDGPTEYYPQGRNSFIWMAPYESYHDSLPGNISTADNIFSSSPESTFGELGYSLPWDGLPWWTSGSAEGLYGAGWPLESFQLTTTGRVSSGDLPEITVTECLFVYSESMLRLKARDIEGYDRSYAYLKCTRSASMPPDATYTWVNPLVEVNDDAYTFIIPAGQTLSQTIPIQAPLKEGISSLSDLTSAEVEVFERDQVANRIPNPKKPYYDAIRRVSSDEAAKKAAMSKYYNRLYISTEPESGNVEIKVRYFKLSSTLTGKLLIAITDSTGNIVASAPMNNLGEADIDFTSSLPMKDAIYYVDLAMPAGGGGAPKLLLKSYEKNASPSIQVDTPGSLGPAQDALAGVVGMVPGGIAQSFYRTFLKEISNPTGATVGAPKIRTIGQEPPTMIAGSAYDQGTWNTEIRSFRLPNGSSASDLVEGYFSKKAGLGLHQVCRDLMDQNHVAIWNDFTATGATSKTYSYPIKPGTVVDFYYDGFNNPKFAWGRANYVSGNVTLKLKKAGTKITAEEVSMNAEFEDYYDFDFTRPNGSFSYWASMIQVGHEESMRPRGKIFHTVTEVDFSYTTSTGALANGGAPIEFFNQNGYIESGAFITAGGGGSGGGGGGGE